MKKRNSFYVSLFIIGIILSFSPILAIEGEGAEGKWEKPEEPKDRQAAEKMKDEAKKERDQADKELEEAEGNKEKTDEAELKKQEALYKLKESIKAEAKFNADEGKISEDKAGKIIKKAEEDQKKIEEEIGKLSKELGGLVEKPTEPAGPTGEKVKKFTDEAKNQFKENVEDLGTSVSEFFDDQLDIIKTEMIKENGLPNYEEQQSALAYLRDLGQKKSTQEYIEKDVFKEEYQKTAKEINERLGEIDKFQKDPPKKLTENDLAETLKLNELIPSDQERALQRELPKITDNEQSLREALGALDNYNLKDREPGLTKYFEDRIKNLEPETEPEVPEELKQMEEQTELFSGGANEEKITGQLTLEQEGGKGTVETIAEYVSWTNEIFRKGLGYAADKAPGMAQEVLASVGEKIAEGGTTALAYGEMMARAPEMVDTAVKTAGTIEGKVKSIKPVVEMLPGETARNVAKQMATVESITKKVAQNKDALSKWGERFGLVGKLISKVGELAKNTGEYLKNFGEKAKEQPKAEQEKTIRDFEKASQRIEQERANIFPKEKQSKYAEIFKPLVDAAKDFSTWIKNLFKEAKPTLAKASKNYESARGDYLTTIGFSKEEIAAKPTDQEIKEKLKAAIADEAKKDELKRKTENFAKRSTELADTFNSVLDKVEGAKASYEWLVAGWDNVAMEKPTSVVGIVNNVIDLRDMRISYLEAARKGVDFIGEDIKLDTQGTGYEELADLLAKRLSRMVSDQMANTIKEYDTVSGQINKSINQERTNLQDFIKQQQQPTNGGPPG